MLTRRAVLGGSIGFGGLGALAMTGCTGLEIVPRPGSGFHARDLVLGGETYRYQVYAPLGWSADRRWPVILYLHGGGEIGRDGIRHLQDGLGPALFHRRDLYPFVVVLPQCRPRAYWAQPEMEAMVLGELREALAEWNGDPRRVYLTGNSMGGYGTWFLAAKHPRTFAALAPICAGVRLPRWLPVRPLPMLSDPRRDPYEEVARRIGSTPVWIFHGGDDWLIPPSESRRMAAVLRRLGGRVRYTEYPGVGHAGAYERTYGSPELGRWLLQHSL